MGGHESNDNEKETSIYRFIDEDETLFGKVKVKEDAS